ncbi:MAG: hypothetical protein IT585_01965 [candidate division Zixibacteria bacterium]|nr:hypothetical protein [candidate division Zixibacteria bacterium]
MKILSLRAAIMVTTLVMLIVVISACAPKAVGIWRDPEFTPSKLNSVPLVLGGIGVRGDDEKAKATLRPLLDSLAWSTLSTELPESNLAPIHYCRNKIGTDALTKIVNKFEVDGLLDSEDLAPLQSAWAPDGSCLIFGRVVEDRVTSEEKYSEKGNYIENKRTIMIYFAVYDAATCRQLWNGGFSLTRSGYSDSEPENTSSTLSDFAVGLLLNFLSPPDPEIPPAGDMITAICRSFARSLAGKE